tara:strand:+ start:833 stop:1219 length:387 start_codon:yes stop_codon:yes gene_type:complete
MGKKSAHTGESPKERSINKMDKFITRNQKRNQHIELLPARRKDPNVPINLWPLKDQLEYYNNRTDKDKFRDKYIVYSDWLTEVQQSSGVYPATFIDYISKLDEVIKELYNTCTLPKEAARVLEKHGVY